jgi:hypothetical protein
MNFLVFFFLPPYRLRGIYAAVGYFALFELLTKLSDFLPRAPASAPLPALNFSVSAPRAAVSRIWRISKMGNLLGAVVPLHVGISDRGASQNTLAAPLRPVCFPFSSSPLRSFSPILQRLYLK